MPSTEGPLRYIFPVHLSPGQHRRSGLSTLVVSLSLLGAACGSGEQGQGTAVAGAADELSTPDDPSESERSVGDDDGENDDEENGGDSADEGAGDDDPSSDDSASSTTEGPDDKDPADGGGSTTSASSTSTSSSTTEPKIDPEVVEVDDLVISEAGIGPVKIGATPDELIEVLGPGFDVDFQKQIRVDFDGYVISKDGQELFSALDTRGEGLDLFITDSPELALASGLGPGTTLADAVSRHGEPSLSYSTLNESREFVEFADGTGRSGSRISFETRDAGIYAAEEEYNETTEYVAEAKIVFVWIS